MLILAYNGIHGSSGGRLCKALADDKMDSSWNSSIYLDYGLRYQKGIQYIQGPFKNK